MSKDGIQAFADEVTLIRHEIDRLQRTSLDKAEAEALHGILAEAVADMRRATGEAPQAIRSALKDDRVRMGREAAAAAASAAQEAVRGVRAELCAERDRLSQSASEARRAALRFTGGVWTLLAATLGLGAFLGLLTANVVETGKTLLSVDQMVRYGCGRPFVGGSVVERDDGASYCARWIVTPEMAEYRKERDGGS